MEASQRTRPERALQSTLQDLQIRSAVEATMQSLLVDVEVASSLHKDLVTVYKEKELQQRIDSTELALQEARALEQQRKEKQTALADELVKELWSLSRDLGELQHWKQTHQPMVDDYDELVAKLLQAEKEIRVLRESRPKVAEESEFPVDALTEEEQKESIEAEKRCLSLEGSGLEKATSSTSEVVAADIDEPAAPEPAAPEPPVPETPVPGPARLDPAEDTESEPVVALLPEEERPTLDTVDMTALTHIFEYLDAIEILSSAQVSVAMYSRVDALFGFSAGEQAPDEGDIPTADAEPMPHNIPAATQASSSATTAASIAAPPSSETASRPSASSSTTATRAPALPSTQLSTTSTTSRPDSLPRAGGIFSLLQARGTRRRVPVPTPGGPSQPLSAAMADSMASKLTDMELGAIISMKENLQKREKDVLELTKQQEELKGKLAGTEALKEFLVTKVREVEQSLSQRREDESKVTQQIASDQEVIAFLDGRVQELEHDIRSLSEEKKSLVEELTRAKVQADKKIAVLSDMLQFERERVSENEREWKATKKLLVKEIKSCRAQLVALQAERDGFREQNERLKRAVVSTNASNGSL